MSLETVAKEIHEQHQKVLKKINDIPVEQFTDPQFKNIRYRLEGEATGLAEAHTIVLKKIEQFSSPL